MVFALLTLVLLASGSRADYGWDLEARILDTIQSVTDLVANQSYILPDAYFGLALAEAQIRLVTDWIWAQGAEQCPIAKYIQRTEEKLSEALKKTNEMRTTNNLIWELIIPDLWEISGYREHSPLKQRGYIPQMSTYIENGIVPDFTMQGTPGGEDSDSCVFSLLHTCAVSPRCWYAQTTTSPPARGYPLTHRLLFLLVARQLECSTMPSFANVSFPARIRNLCERILIDSKTIQSLDYPQKYRDLFVEEVTLCGMEGYREFTNRDWVENILSWKSPSGCFPQAASRRKRNDYIVDNCSLHFSGLGAASLSIALRNMLEDTQLRDCMKV